MGSREKGEGGKGGGVDRERERGGERTAMQMVVMVKREKGGREEWIKLEGKGEGVGDREKGEGRGLERRRD